MGVVTPGPDGEPPVLEPLVLKPATTNEATVRDLLAAARWLRAHPELPPCLHVELYFASFMHGPDGPLAREELSRVADALDDPIERYDPSPRGRLGRVSVRGEIGEVVRVRADAYADDLGAVEVGPFYEPIVRRHDGGS